MSRSETENLTEQLKKAVLSGQMTADELIDRLRRMIDAELAKDDREIDADFVRACDDLLTELCGIPEPREDGYYERQWAAVRQCLADRSERKRNLRRAAAIAAAAVLIVVLLGSVSIHLRWFRPYSTTDGLQYHVNTAQFSIDSVAHAHVTHQVGSSYQTDQFEQIEDFLGFSLESVVPVLPGWRAESYSADILDSEIRMKIHFQRDEEVNETLDYTVRWITNFTFLYDASQPEGEGEFISVSGNRVFKSMDDGGISYFWSRGMEIYLLKGAAADEVIESFLSLNPVKDEPVTEEVIRKTFEKYYPFRSFASDRLEEVENFLGFSLSSFLPALDGWKLYSAHTAVFPDSLIIHFRYQSMQRYDAALSFDIHWILYPEEIAYPIEQDEAGKYLTIAGRTAYRSTNYGNISYVWFGKNVFYDLFGEPEIDTLVERFMNPGAAPYYQDDEPAVSADEPESPEKKLETEYLYEAETWLGFSLNSFLPDLEGWAAENYILEQDGQRTNLRVIYRQPGPDGEPLVYQVSWIPDYESFREIQLEQDQAGRYRWVKGDLVFRNEIKDGDILYTWHRGPTVRTLTGASADEQIRFFVSVGNRESVEEEEEVWPEEEPEQPAFDEPIPETDGATGVTRAALAELAERHGLHSGIITDDLDEVEEYLGFSPEPILPSQDGWETEYYTVRLNENAISLSTVLRNTQRDHDTMSFYVAWITNEQYLWEEFKRTNRYNKILLDNGRSLYWSADSNQMTYFWIDGFTRYQLSGKSAEELINQFFDTTVQEREPEIIQ